MQPKRGSTKKNQIKPGDQKNTIYRVMWLKPPKWEAGWCVVVGYRVGDINSNEGTSDVPYLTKALAADDAIEAARRNQPSQVIIYSKSRATGRYHITKRVTYGSNSNERRSDANK